ncbi:MAG TPA: tRNA pseudouridine(54/55) synthase Pus10, partial [Candidatus Poseidoniia archaeon]|nr:tRNA pseudouridine(54/55) synthase Pus10 [Candidatus Poseidoniia archaeon]
AVAIIDTSYDTIDLEIKSLFIEGNYNKFDRTVPQTRWPCSSCKGIGCRKCDNTGQLYPDSVQSLIASYFIRESFCTEDLFHGMGREGIDAAMLGDGRPFVLELRMPKVRDLNLEGLEKEINEANNNRIKVNNLRFVDRPRVAELKNTVCDKSYRVDVSVSDITSIESLKKGSQRLTGT